MSFRMLVRHYIISFSNKNPKQEKKNRPRRIVATRPINKFPTPAPPTHLIHKTKDSRGVYYLGIRQNYLFHLFEGNLKVTPAFRPPPSPQTNYIFDSCTPPLKEWVLHCKMIICGGGIANCKRV